MSKFKQTKKTKTKYFPKTTASKKKVKVTAVKKETPQVTDEQREELRRRDGNRSVLCRRTGRLFRRKGDLYRLREPWTDPLKLSRRRHHLPLLRGIDAGKLCERRKYHRTALG